MSYETVKNNLIQITQALMVDDEIRARYTFGPSVCTFDSHRDNFEATLHERQVDGGHDSRPTLVITASPSRHPRPMYILSLPPTYQEALSELSDEGDPLDDEYDSIRWRVLWLLAQVHHTKGHKTCGLPDHKLLSPSPYHDEAAILLSDCNEIVTFRFYD